MSEDRPTVRELADELSSYARDLKESNAKLGDELRNIDNSKKGLTEELEASLRSFIKEELKAPEGEKFNRFDTLCQETPDVADQSLSFTRDKMLEEREAALRYINIGLGERFDAQGLAAKIDEIKETLEEMENKRDAAGEAYRAADAVKRKWLATKEYGFVELNKKLVEAGELPLTDENNEYYDPEKAISKLANWLTRGGVYKEIRDALFDYGHNDATNNVFAKVPEWEEKTKDIEGALSAAEKKFNLLKNDANSERVLVEKLESVAAGIKTDDQILEVLQDKTVGYFKSKAFTEAVAKEYAEGFPRNVMLLSVKIEALDKLRGGVETKIGQLRVEQEKIIEQCDKIDKINRKAPYRELTGVRLSDMRKQRSQRVSSYNGYANAAHYSCDRAVCYAPPPTIIYQDNSWGFWEGMMIADMMNDHHHEPPFGAPMGASFAPEIASPLEEKGEHSDGILPDIDFPDSFSELMSDVGFGDKEKRKKSNETDVDNESIFDQIADEISETADAVGDAVASAEEDVKGLFESAEEEIFGDNSEGDSDFPEPERDDSSLLDSIEDAFDLDFD